MGQPNQVFIIGAGFSKWISSQMLTADELGKKVVENFKSKESLIPEEYITNLFESWLTRLADEQPYNSQDEVLSRKSLFLQIANEVATVMEQQVTSITASDNWICYNLVKLIRILHANRSKVISYNYDTLIEHSVDRIGPLDISDWESPVTYLDVVGFLPKLVGCEYTSYSNTFEILKLHGSIDCWWVPNDNVGDTIVRLHYFGEPNPSFLESSRYSNSFHYSTGEQQPQFVNKLTVEQVRNKYVPGKERLIVPPITGKSAFYSNPIMRQIWNQARKAIASADEIHLVGYSLPSADVSSIGLLREYINSNTKVIIANTEADQVRKTILDNSIAIKDNVVIYQDIDSWIDNLESKMIERAVYELNNILEKKLVENGRSRVAVNCNHNGAILVTDLMKKDGILILHLASGCDPKPLRYLAIHGCPQSQGSNVEPKTSVSLRDIADKLKGIKEIVANFNDHQYKIIDVNFTPFLIGGTPRPYMLVFSPSMTIGLNNET